MSYLSTLIYNLFLSSSSLEKLLSLTFEIFIIRYLGVYLIELNLTGDMWPFSTGYLYPSLAKFGNLESFPLFYHWMWILYLGTFRFFLNLNNPNIYSFNVFQIPCKLSSFLYILLSFSPCVCSDTLSYPCHFLFDISWY